MKTDITTKYRATGVVQRNYTCDAFGNETLLTLALDDKPTALNLHVSETVDASGGREATSSTPNEQIGETSDQETDTDTIEECPPCEDTKRRKTCVPHATRPSEQKCIVTTRPDALITFQK